MEKNKISWGKILFLVTFNIAGLSLIIYSLLNFKGLSAEFIIICLLFVIANLFPVDLRKDQSVYLVLTTVIIILAILRLSFTQTIVISLLSIFDYPFSSRRKWYKRMLYNINSYAIMFAISKFIYYQLKAPVSIYESILPNIPVILALAISVIGCNFLLVIMDAYLVDGIKISSMKKFFIEGMVVEIYLIPFGFLLAIIFHYQPEAIIFLVIPVIFAFVGYRIKRQLSAAKEQAIRDKLTGLFNRHLFDEQIAIQMAQAKRKGVYLSLLILDLDNFKSFNDNFGHPEGDIALKKVADIITSVARKSDICCRYGGEEFVIILPDTPSNGAVYVGNKIRKAIQKEKIGSPAMVLTSSIGAATYPQDCQNKKDLLEIADKNLYKAKHSGKNAVKHLKPIPSPNA